VSFEEEIRKSILDRHTRINRIVTATEASWGYSNGRKEGDPERKVTYWWLGDGTGFQYQTDHIVPVHAGGKGIDPKNLQVLCVPCHINKTKKDRKIYGRER
jgi:5-methylcytosine-specific restriction endonuclease McrA